MAELDVRCSVRVDRSPEQVWSFVAASYFDHHHLWDPAVVGMRQLAPGPVGVGTTGEESRKLGPLTQRTTFTVDRFEPTGRFAFHDTSGPFDLRRSYDLSPAGPDGSATELSFRFVMAPRGGVRLVFPLLRRGIERQVRANIERIPGLVETPI